MLPIFLAEDDPVIRAHLIAVIDAVADAQVIASAGTQDDASAWLKLHSGEWDLAVLDLFLEQGSGFGILESMVDESDRNRVIILTNSVTEENRSRCLALGAHLVFDKTNELDAFLHFCAQHPSQVSRHAWRAV